ncbi:MULTISPECIES: reverse transcriptase domain-containing protein [Thioalkalivibrio]|uniref:RNA-directed DNA polymerase n=1 Tax=Thioalkalivibrio halophilus TaxID=252474 RepID=A0A1V3A0I4_9GAMM|nr:MULTISPECIES: reverse transcriptase domain-containing protein [Thioalkalivibrio]OOC10841.1 Retron-type reverse transcriptase [Thioalkalivibrio halophilus]
MNALLDSMVDPENVQKAWRRVRRDRAPWSPEVNREHLDQALPRHLLRLVQDLQTGRYRPGAMRQFAVAKGDGGRRVISAQYLRDKLAQRMAHQVLEPRVEPFLHPDSFGYRPGRGVPHALHRVRERIATGLDWVVDADIRSFFDQVPHRGVRRELKRFVRDRGLRRLIDRWLVAGSHSASLAGSRRGVPQGAVLSPLLCNIFLDRLDRSLADAGIPFVRYADDFLLLAATRTDAERARSHVDRCLRRMGLELHPDKTRVSRVSPRVRFLGEPVVRRSRATRKRRQ